MAKKSLKTPLDLPAPGKKSVSERPLGFVKKGHEASMGSQHCKGVLLRSQGAAATPAVRQVRFRWRLAGTPRATTERLLGVMVANCGLESALTGPWM